MNLKKKSLIVIPICITLVCIIALAGVHLVLRANLNFQLYRGESYKVPDDYLGNPTELLRNIEYASFYKDAKAVIAAQRNLQEENGGVAKRVFHAKSHACLTGRLRILPQEANSKTNVGLFKTEDGKGKEYQIIARFSNGVGVERHDLLPDVRGVGIKIFGVQNAETGKQQTMDLLMTNSSNPFGRDHAQFVDFMRANARPGLLKSTTATIAWALKQKKEDPREPNMALHFLRSTWPVGSLAETAFFSGHPYLMGNDHAAKFVLRPRMQHNKELGTMSLNIEGILGNVSQFSAEDFPVILQRIKDAITIKKINRNYLALDLEEKIAAGSLIFDLAVQEEQDDRTTPIENTLIPWTSPEKRVAVLIFDKQDPSWYRNNACENFRFTPGHYIPEHRPLGNMARGRLFGYEASQIGRGASGTEPPTSTPDIFRRGLFTPEDIEFASKVEASIPVSRALHQIRLQNLVIHYNTRGSMPANTENSLKACTTSPMLDEITENMCVSLGNGMLTQSEIKASEIESTNVRSKMKSYNIKCKSIINLTCSHMRFFPEEHARGLDKIVRDKIEKFDRGYFADLEIELNNVGFSVEVNRQESGTP